MLQDKNLSSLPIYKKAEELKVVFEFEADQAIDSKQRSDQVKEIISQMLLLARKRGRPSTKEETYEKAA